MINIWFKKVKANNDDGQKIIGDMKLKGVDLEVGMNALIGSMLKEGYISELKNSLLISVTGDHQKENEVLRKELSDEIDQLLKNHHIEWISCFFSAWRWWKYWCFSKQISYFNRKGTIN